MNDELDFPWIIGRRRFFPGRKKKRKNPDGLQPSKSVACRAVLTIDNSNKIQDREVSDHSMDWKIGAKRSKYNPKALKKRIGKCICRAVIDIKNSGKEIIALSGRKTKNPIKDNNVPNEIKDDKSRSNKKVDSREDLTEKIISKETIVKNVNDNHEKIQIVLQENIEECSSNDDKNKDSITVDSKISTNDNEEKETLEEADVAVNEDLNINKVLFQPHILNKEQEENAVLNNVDTNSESINYLTFNKEGEADSPNSINMEGTFDISNSSNTFSSDDGNSTRNTLTVHTPRSSQDLTSYWRKKKEWSRRESIYKSTPGYNKHQHKINNLSKSSKTASFFIKFYTKMKNLEALQSFLPIGQKTRITQRNDITCVHWQANP